MEEFKKYNIDQYSECMYCRSHWFRINVIPCKIIECESCKLSIELPELVFDIINQSIKKEDKNKVVRLERIFFNPVK